MDREERLELPIYANFQVKESKNQINEITEYFSRMVGRKVDTTTSKLIDKESKKYLTFIKTQDGYLARQYQLTEHKGVLKKSSAKKAFSKDISFSEQEVEILSKSTSKDLKSNYKNILEIRAKEYKELKKQEALSRQQKKEDKEKVKNEERFEKEKQEYLDKLEKEKQKKKIARAKALSKIVGGDLINTKTLTPSLSKLVSTIKRVGFYRIARNVFRFIENGFKKGINDLIQFDEQANKTMSNLATSFDKITASFTLIAMPLIDILEPIISQLSEAISSFAENISMASASMKGMTTYTKLNKNYMRDLAQEASKTNLSFDKFESLNIKDSIYVQDEITEEQQESAKKYIDILQTIKNIFTSIIETAKTLFKTIEPYIEPTIEFISKIIEGAVSIIEKIVKTLDKLGILQDTLVLIAITIISMKIINFITNIVSGVSNIIKFIKALNLNLQTTSSILGGILIGFAIFKIFDGILQNAPKWVSTLTMLAGAIALFAIGIALAMGDFPKAIAIPALMAAGATMLAGAKGTLGVSNQSLYYENQSLPTTNAITNTPTIENNNLQNIQNATVSTLNQFEETKSSDYGDIVLNLDGAEIARSKRFNTEMNIRNASLNLR